MSTLISDAFTEAITLAGRKRFVALIIDEGDALAFNRSAERAHHEDRVGVNTLIQKIDDARQLSGRLLIFLCTNRYTALDPAILRRAALIDEFQRPDERERRELFTATLAGVDITPQLLDKLAEITGPHDERPSFTFSDIQTRLLPAAIARAYPERALTADDLIIAAAELEPISGHAGKRGVVRGLRVHITGSAAADGDDALIAAAHSFVRALAAETIAYGGGLVLGAGGEPRNETGQPCIFDWTALEVIADAPDPAPGWPQLRPERFVAVASQRGLDKIPACRAEIWERCCRRSDFQLVVAPPGWRMAGIIRERQVLRGDILLALGGGAGAEHLAELYSDEGKPVVPIRAELGAYNHDGNGGSRFLHAAGDRQPR